MQRIVFGMNDTEVKKFTLDWYTVCRKLRKAQKVHKALIILLSGR